MRVRPIGFYNTCWCDPLFFTAPQIRIKAAGWGGTLGATWDRDVIVIKTCVYSISQALDKNCVFFSIDNTQGLAKANVLPGSTHLGTDKLVKPRLFDFRVVLFRVLSYTSCLPY